jgi:hypothetical protein
VIAFSKIEIANDFSGGDIDNHHVAAVSARLANAGVAIDWNIRQFPIARCSDLVPGHSAFGYLGYLFSSNRIDDPQAVVAFVGNQQQAIPGRPATGLGQRDESEGQKKKEDQEEDTHIWLRLISISSVRELIFTDQQAVMA